MKKKLVIVASVIALTCALVLLVHLATRNMDPQRLLQQLHGG